MTGSPGARPSLRTRLARHVVLPLVLTWALGSAVALAVANHFAGLAFDRALLDDAYAMAAHVKRTPAGLVLEMSPGEMNTLMFDQSESGYFAVFGADQRLVAGRADLAPAPLVPGETYGFSDFSLNGRELHGVSLHRSEPAQFTVVMAQTTSTRNQLLRRMLAWSAIPQGVLLLFLAWWLRRAIGNDLRPLAQLQHALERRDANDLTPLPPSLTAGASTADVERLGSALDSLLVRLSASMTAQREFAGNVAHELRTPLAGIRAQATYALGHSDPAVWRAQLQAIAQGEQRATHLVDQLLALARADEGGGSMQLRPLPLNEIARTVLLQFLRRADAAGVDLGAEGLDEPVRVLGDTALLEGILGNLIDNALRYGVAEHPRVTLTLTREGDDALLTVTDNGPGMDVQQAQELSRRWMQGPEGQRLGAGAGLGLAIVARYAQLLGATFTLEPAAGGGLSAVLRLRALPAEAGQPDAPVQASVG